MELDLDADRREQRANAGVVFANPERVGWRVELVAGQDLTRESIKASPEFTADSLLTRGYEHGLYGHYNRMGYWKDALGAAA